MPLVPDALGGRESRATSAAVALRLALLAAGI
jgi:hypothetical protein